MTTLTERSTIPALRARPVRVDWIESAQPADHFRVELPEGFRATALPRDDGELFPALAAFADLDRPGRQVHVRRALLPREVNVLDWAAADLERTSDEVLERADVGPDRNPRGEFVTRLRRGDVDHVRWSRVLASGPRAFRVDFLQPDGPGRLSRAAASECLGSFTLLRPSRLPFAEPWRRVADRKPVPWQFAVPASWAARQDVSAGERSVAVLTNDVPGAGCVGRITVEVRRPGAGGEPVAAATELARQVGAERVRLNGAAVLPTAAPRGFTAAHAFLPRGTLDGHPVDFAALLLEHRLARVIVALLGPSRQASAEWWAINLRAFEIVRDSLRLGDA